MNLIPQEDINYLTQQSSDKINMILSGMTALMNDTENKVQAMESQGWFQRMLKTVIGKNKATKAEIQRNHDKLNAYMSQAIAELFNRSCIDYKVMMSLGHQINELYADHVQLKAMLGAFVSKLNQKIDSIDNFHILVTEIEQGVYSDCTSIVGICKVMSQLDKRTLEDNRKLDIIKRSLLSQNIINDQEKSIKEYLMDIVNISIEEVGQIHLELGSIRGNFIADLFTDMIEKYHFLPDMNRMMINKTSLVSNVISENNLDENVNLSIKTIYTDLINSKIEIKNNFSNIAINSEIEKVEYIEENYYNHEDFYNDINLAKQEIYNKNYDEAIQWLLRPSQSGYDEAQNLLGFCYYTKGEKESENYKNAFEWFLKSAQNGNLNSQSNVALCYYLGIGIDKDKYKAREWLRKSANQGYDISKLRLKVWFNEGDCKDSFFNQSFFSQKLSYIESLCKDFAIKYNEKYDSDNKDKAYIYNNEESRISIKLKDYLNENIYLSQKIVNIYSGTIDLYNRIIYLPDTVYRCYELAITSKGFYYYRFEKEDNLIFEDYTSFEELVTMKEISWSRNSDLSCKVVFDEKIIVWVGRYSDKKMEDFIKLIEDIRDALKFELEKIYIIKKEYL